MSLVLSSSAGKSHLIHLIDTPGHVNFVDEVASAMRLVDGIVVVVDVIEGVMVNTEAVVRHALQEGIKITLVVNKIDRLILELRIKPADAYYKIKHTIEELNTFIRYHVPPSSFYALPSFYIQWYKSGPRPSAQPRKWQRRIRKYRHGLVFHPTIICADVRRYIW